MKNQTTSVTFEVLFANTLVIERETTRQFTTALVENHVFLCELFGILP